MKIFRTICIGVVAVLSCLPTFAQQTYEELEQLTVNEQNPLAKGFYEHMGFHVYKRSELDEQGNPYPLLYMRLK